MLNFTRKVVLLLIGVIIGLWAYGYAIPVDAHHQGDFFPIDRQYYKLETQAEITGTWQWSYEERCNQGDIYDAVSGAFADTASRYRVVSVPRLVTPGSSLTIQNNVSTCGADFTGRCGAGFAVACVGPDGARFPVNCDAFYDGPYMATFVSLASKESVVKHEYTHCRDGRAEGYCDTTESSGPCSTGVTCQPSDTIMGCGPNHPLDYSQHDDQAFAARHYPPALSKRGWSRNGAGLYLWACNFDPATTRLAVIYDDGAGKVFSGVSRPLVTDSNGCQGIGVLEGVQFPPTSRKYYLKQENELSWRDDLNEVQILP